MKAVIQRVSKAKIYISGKVISEISQGFLVFLGIGKEDGELEVEWLSNKIANLRIMGDNKGKMNLNLRAVKGEILIVSQFTLCSDLSGNRPSFSSAAKPYKAKKLYELFIQRMKRQGIRVKTGVFGALMEVELLNDGPVTIIIDKLC